MKVFKGFASLQQSFKDLPSVGWIYIKRGMENNSRNELVEALFYIPENEEDEINCEENFNIWLESPTFQDILINKIEHHPESSINDFLDAAIYYLEMDDFLD